MDKIKKNLEQRATGLNPFSNKEEESNPDTTQNPDFGTTRDKGAAISLPTKPNLGNFDFAENVTAGVKPGTGPRDKRDITWQKIVIDKPEPINYRDLQREAAERDGRGDSSSTCDKRDDSGKDSKTTEGPRILNELSESVFDRGNYADRDKRADSGLNSHDDRDGRATWGISIPKGPADDQDPSTRDKRDDDNSLGGEMGPSGTDHYADGLERLLNNHEMLEEIRSSGTRDKRDDNESGGFHKSGKGPSGKYYHNEGAPPPADPEMLNEMDDRSTRDKRDDNSGGINRSKWVPLEMVDYPILNLRWKR